MTRDEAAQQLPVLADGLRKLAYSKRTWLHDHGEGKAKRPDWEIEIRRSELDTLERAEQWISWMAGKYAKAQS